MEIENGSRREFFSQFGQLAVAGAFLQPIMDAGLLAKSMSHPETRQPMVLDLTKPENMVLTRPGGALKTPGFHHGEKPIIVSRLSDTEYAAFSSKCAHWGCEVPLPVDNVITCPCHKSKYDARGKVTHGPARKNLRQYAATVNGSLLTIEETAQ